MSRTCSLALVPGESFAGGPATPVARYANADMWFARPGIANNPALWTPTNFKPGEKPMAAVFFIHPTSYIDRAHWNAPVDNEEANGRAALFLRGQASVFNEAGQVWAPRYRQATFGAFLTGQKEATEALDFAYRDVAAAFDEFLKEIGPDRPIILEGLNWLEAESAKRFQKSFAGASLRKLFAPHIKRQPV